MFRRTTKTRVPIYCTSCHNKCYIHPRDKNELAETDSDYYCEHCMNDLGHGVYDTCDKCKRLAFFNKEDMISCIHNGKEKLCNACLETIEDYSDRMIGFSFADEHDVYYDKDPYGDDDIY